MLKRSGTLNVAQQRVVAYVDILGFRKIVERLPREPTLRENLRSILARLAESDLFNATWGRESYVDSINITTFSDCTVISKPTDEPRAERIVTTKAPWLAVEFLQLGFPSRGALVHGWLHHEGHLLVGAGMVRAYEIETTTAKWPRIVVEDTVRAAVLRHLVGAGPNGAPEDEFFLRDDDGRWVLSPFSEAAMKGHNASDDEVYARCRASIEEGMRRERQDRDPKPETLDKYRWIAARFNEAVTRRGGSRVEPLDLWNTEV